RALPVTSDASHHWRTPPIDPPHNSPFFGYYPAPWRAWSAVYNGVPGHLLPGESSPVADPQLETVPPPPEVPPQELVPKGAPTDNKKPVKTTPPPAKR